MLHTLLFVEIHPLYNVPLPERHTKYMTFYFPVSNMFSEQRHEKICRQVLRPGKTQISFNSYTELVSSKFRIKELVYEPRCENTGLRGFRPGPTQTGLHSH